MHGVGWDGWLVMSLGMIVFWSAIIWLIVLAVRAGSRTTSHESARDILDRRLAEGEISVEEYEKRRQLLSGPPKHAAVH